MKNYQLSYNFKFFIFLMIGILSFSIAGCSDNDSVAPELIIDDSQKSINIAWNEIESALNYTSSTSWTAQIADEAGQKCNWLKLHKYYGEGGEISNPILFEANDSEISRTAIISIISGDVELKISVVQQANPNAVLTMKESDVKDFNKYYKPTEFNNINMLKSDAKWSWFRSAQSEHFFVFWESGFGDNPNAESVAEAMRVDIDDLLAKAEEFYKMNVETLKFVETGKSRSYLDKYKMEIYLLYQDEWLATGSGYDNTIGALWVNPSTCKPVGSTIAHEIGHSFQYQVGCDKVLNGETDYSKVGFRYGYGNNGDGGNAFWEQCAQWQSFQNYPSELFGYHVDVWKANYHRHFNHEWMRYASYWLQYYWTQKHGIEAVGNIWKESTYPEDPLMTYKRIYCNNSLNDLYKELYDYASHMVTYDIDGIRNMATESACNYSTKVFETNEGYYQVGYSSCPGTTGFNIIQLNLPSNGNTIKVYFQGMASGSALADSDMGKVIDGDGNTVDNVRNYNATNNIESGWRYGFVSIVNGKAIYSSMYSNKNDVISYEVPQGATKLYMVIMGAPSSYTSHPWNDNERDDLQWPYKVKFEGTDLFGSFYVDETAIPKNVTLNYDLKCNSTSADYILGNINLSLNQTLAQAFALKPINIEGKLLPVGQQSAEGKIAIALTLPDDTYSYAGNANNGFWCTSDGNIGGWANGGVYFEFSGMILSYGHRPDMSIEAGKKAVMKPTLIYTKDGKQYKATIILNMQF